jgi:hypothetical protein
VDGDPLQDMAALQQMAWVMQGGRVAHSPDQATGA